jgi:TolB-like protein
VINGAQSGRPQVRFGPFEVDFKAGELRKRRAKVKLQDQPFQVLQVLLEHPGELVSREELRQRIWPADTFVDFDQGLNNAVKRLREALGDSSESPRFIETIPRRGYRFIGEMEAATKPTANPIQSLVVLPLDNLSHDPEQEYFADGLTESLITNLAKISALRVISRTTAMNYKGVRRALPEIARDLGVDAVVEGTVLRAGERVRISAQLIDACDDRHFWAESYERDMRDVLTLHADLAQAIAKQIQIRVTPRERALLQKVGPVDPDAYENYLRGRYFFAKRGGDMLQKGMQAFQRAITNDATYAAAHAGLADCVSLLGWFAFVSPEEGCGEAKRLALKAVEMDPELAEGHTSLGRSSTTTLTSCSPNENSGLPSNSARFTNPLIIGSPFVSPQWAALRRRSQRESVPSNSIRFREQPTLTSYMCIGVLVNTRTWWNTPGKL